MNLIHKYLQAILRTNLQSFIAKSFHTTSPGNPYLHNWHIDLIAEKLEEVRAGNIKRLIVNMPPRYLKSICINVAWPAWLLSKNPSTKIMTASYSQALSNKHSQDCRLLMQSDWYRDCFPWVKIAKGENQKSKFVTTDRGFRLATSTGGTATGEGGDFLIIDDPQNPNKIQSRKYRETTIEWFEQTFISRLNNKKTGAIVIVMQRLHAEDLCGYLLENKADQWELLKLPAIYQQRTIYHCPYEVIKLEQSVLHSEREDLQSLHKLMEELGHYNFSAQYLQDPVSGKGSMIQKSWIQYYSQKSRPMFDQIIQSWDTAIKAKDEHDYTVSIVIGVNKSGYYLLDLYRAKVEFPELIIAVQDFAKKWRPNAILVEDKASGQSLIQSLKADIVYPIIGIKPKYDKVTRFASHTPLFEAGKIFIPLEADWRLNFEQELLNFPKASNDDQVDALSQALSYLQQRKLAQIRML